MLNDLLLFKYSRHLNSPKVFPFAGPSKGIVDKKLTDIYFSAILKVMQRFLLNDEEWKVFTCSFKVYKAISDSL